jgi:hypothetical protein
MHPWKQGPGLERFARFILWSYKGGFFLLEQLNESYAVLANTARKGLSMARFDSELIPLMATPIELLDNWVVNRRVGNSLCKVSRAAIAVLTWATPVSTLACHGPTSAPGGVVPRRDGH